MPNLVLTLTIFVHLKFKSNITMEIGSKELYMKASNTRLNSRPNLLTSLTTVHILVNPPNLTVSICSLKSTSNRGHCSLNYDFKVKPEYEYTLYGIGTWYCHMVLSHQKTKLQYFELFLLEIYSLQKHHLYIGQKLRHPHSKRAYNCHTGAKISTLITSIQAFNWCGID